MKLTKSYLKQLIKEAAAEYVWGVKNPGRVANQYTLQESKKSVTEAARDPQAAAVQQEMIKSLNQFSEKDRQPVAELYQHLMRMLSVGDPAMAKSTIDIISMQFTQFKNMLD